MKIIEPHQICDVELNLLKQGTGLRGNKIRLDEDGRLVEQSPFWMFVGAAVIGFGILGWVIWAIVTKEPGPNDKPLEPGGFICGAIIIFGPIVFSLMGRDQIIDPEKRTIEICRALKLIRSRINGDDIREIIMPVYSAGKEGNHVNIILVSNGGKEHNLGYSVSISHDLPARSIMEIAIYISQLFDLTITMTAHRGVSDALVNQCVLARLFEQVSNAQEIS